MSENINVYGNLDLHGGELISASLEKVTSLPVSGFTGQIIYFDAVSATISRNAKIWDGTKWKTISVDNTDELAEGVNHLYYSVDRFNQAFASKTTDDLAEGLKKYYSDDLVELYVGVNYSAIDHVHTYGQLTGRPTTLSGFGISSDDSLFDSKYFRSSGGTISGNVSISNSNFTVSGNASIAEFKNIQPYQILLTNNVSSWRLGTNSSNQFKLVSPSSVEFIFNENGNVAFAGRVSGQDAQIASEFVTLSQVQSTINSISNFYTKTEIGNILNGTTVLSGYSKSNWDLAYTQSHTHSNKALLDAIQGSQITAWNLASSKIVSSVTVTGSQHKTITVTFADATVITAEFDDIDANTSFLSNPLWTSTTGDLSFNRDGLATIDVNLDGRYLRTETDPTVPAHVKSITNSNIVNWDFAFNKSIVSGVVTGTETKTLALTMQSGEVLEVSWSAIDTELNNYPTNIAFNTANGVLTLSRNALTDITTNLDGRYYLLSNPSNFITSSALNGYALQSWVVDNYVSLNYLSSYTGFDSRYLEAGDSGNFIQNSSTLQAATFHVQNDSIIGKALIGTIEPDQAMFKNVDAPFYGILHDVEGNLYLNGTSIKFNLGGVNRSNLSSTGVWSLSNVEVNSIDNSAIPLYVISNSGTFEPIARFKNTYSTNQSYFDIGIGHSGSLEDHAIFRLNDIIVSYINTTGDTVSTQNFKTYDDMGFQSNSSSNSYYIPQNSEGHSIISSTGDLIFKRGAVESGRIRSSGNFSLGNPNDEDGAVLQLKGDLSIEDRNFDNKWRFFRTSGGRLAISRRDSLLPAVSFGEDTTEFSIGANNNFQFGVNGIYGTIQFPTGVIEINGTSGITLGGIRGTLPTASVDIIGSSLSATLNVSGNVTLASGTKIHKQVSITPTFNITGENVEVRGIYYNPVLTSMVGVITHNAIETTAGNWRLDGGKFGIGTNAVTNFHIADTESKIRLESNGNFDGGFGNYIYFAGKYSSNTVSTFASISSHKSNINSGDSSGSLHFSINDGTGAENLVTAMIINSTGNVVVGNNADDLVNKLQVYGKGYFAGTVSGYDAVDNSDFVTLSQLNEVVSGGATLTNYYTKTESNSTFKSINWFPSFDEILTKPTTLDGYGIEDTYTITQITALLLNKVQNTRSITATGNGIIGGGTLEADRTISIDFNYFDGRYSNQLKTEYGMIGLRNEVNLIFSTTQDFKVGSTRVYLNGSRMFLGEDYTELNLSSIQFSADKIIDASDNIIIDYVLN